MNRLITRVLVVAAVVSLLGVTKMAQAADLKVGDAAPDFSLAGSDGKTHKLSELKGKTVVLAWFPRAFTGGCTKECKSFAEDGKEMKKLGAVYFTASTDEAKKNKEFAESLNCDYPILSDPTTETAKAYGVVGPDGKPGADGKPATGAKRTTFIIGGDGKILDIETKVETATHAKDMAKKLEELAAKKK